jgi:DNA modification methylase
MSEKSKKSISQKIVAPISPSQSDMFEKSYEEELEAQKTQPVVCLGLKFPNDDARREHFLKKLAEKLKDPAFRKIEGFPIGSDEDIRALSDPPYYTACPNPWLAEIVKGWIDQKLGVDHEVNYRREPFAVDVSEGKTDPIYKAHSYHTKVPHLAIVPSILHYTIPGDIVLDGFSGSGMTGVAAQWCGSAPQTYKTGIEERFKKLDRIKPVWGGRHVVLNDLSPAATLITANYNIPFNVREFAKAGAKLLSDIEAEIGWMYNTLHTDGKTKGRIEYTVWSEVFTCPDCAGDVLFLDEALDEKTQQVRESFPCPHCAASLCKDKLERVFETRRDPASGKSWKHVKFLPSIIVYQVKDKTHRKSPTDADLQTLKLIDEMPLPGGVPTNRFPIEEMGHGSRIAPKGFTHVHHFYLPRAAHAMANLWEKASAYPNSRMKHMLLYFVEQAIWGLSVLNRYQPIQHGRPGGSQVNRQLTGVYYIASQHAEVSPWYNLSGKLKRIASALKDLHTFVDHVGISTGTASSLNVPANSIDYIFTDPPFGENIPYADLNYLVESWHRVVTNNKSEATVDKSKKKSLTDYQQLMRDCFAEYCRVLKPGRWMTVVFHNSQNAVWTAIQEAMTRSGFVVADVRTLDKQQGSYRQVTSTAVKQDLVISAYKPNGGLEARFKLEAGTEEGVWDFVRTHLRQLPVYVAKNKQVEIIAERQKYLLFDRMVAFHVQRGVTFSLSSTEFFSGVEQRFSERDGMFFLPDQVAEYDAKKSSSEGVVQFELFITDEASALQWLRRQLENKPQTFSDLTPQFMKEIAGWEKHEKPLELKEILQQNFICYDGKEDVPPQIHSYLSTNFKECRKLAKNDPSLREHAKDRYYVPDPKKAGDLEKIRERALLREFWEYLPDGYKPQTKLNDQEPDLPGMSSAGAKIPQGKKMKVLRMEAVRSGFKYCWQNRDYRTIVTVAKRIPEEVLQEDPKLLMWYDQAVTRLGEE